ncbi:ScyD/ScyE family protein [Chloroflexi bacterium TSY]|nr:ScyD/ScyE family protein [Chloroflexi bacterium TSY]
MLNQLQSKPQINVVLDDLLAPVGMAVLPDGTLLIAEEGTGDDDQSAGITLLKPDGQHGRLISGLPSSRDAGDLAGVPLVSVSPDGSTIYVGNFAQQHLWALTLTHEEQKNGIELPSIPLSPDQLTPVMTRLNNVFLVNPFDMTYDANGVPVVADASENGVAKQNPDGTTRFFHRFEQLPNPQRPSNPIEAVPTGIERVSSGTQENEYYVALFGGCPYPVGSGQIVAIDEMRNQRTIVDGLNLPIDVAQGVDGTIWVLEFARFETGASCFESSGYLPQSGRLSRLHPNGSLETILDSLNFPGAVLPMPDGTLYISEVFSGRILRVDFSSVGPNQDVLASRTTVTPQPSLVSNAPASQPSRPKADLYFTDVASSVGINFRHGAFHNRLSMDPVAAMGGGLCWLDYDNDGWLDLYLVNSHALDEVEDWLQKGGLPKNQLLHNEGGYFVDVSEASGTDAAIRGNGCVAADFNNDRLVDLFITADGPNLLYWNRGNGLFKQGAQEAGIAAPEWNSAAVAGDLNGDGLLDLYVAGYIDLTKKVPKPTGHFPQDYFGIPDRLYLNQGASDDGFTKFREITLEAGLTRSDRGLGALLSDLDNDGDLELYVANDGHRNRLYLNEPWVDREAVDPAGLGFHLIDWTANADVGDSGSGMGVTSGDYDGDGTVDLFVTNWQNELNALYRNKLRDVNDLTFQYSTYRIGIAGLGNGLTGWGAHLADFDHDMDVDLLVVNGRVPITDLESDSQLVRYYRNRTYNTDGVENRVGHFLDWTRQVGLDELGPLMARGSAVADYDNDGDLDVAINSVAGEAVLLQNNTNDFSSANLDADRNWLVVDVEDHLPGTRVTVQLRDGRTIMREIYAGSSYLASEDPRLHFGFGHVQIIPKLTVRWPNGHERVLIDVSVNQSLFVQE